MTTPDLLVAQAEAVASRIVQEAVSDALTLEDRLRCLAGVSSFLRASRPSHTVVDHRHQTRGSQEEGLPFPSPE